MGKKLVVAIAIILAMAVSASADWAAGSAFGCMTTASSLGQGKGNLGGGIGLGDATCAFGSFKYGLSKYTDGRLRLGFRDDDEANIAFGADFKWQFWNVGQGRREPFEMAVGGFFEFDDYNGGSISQFGGQLIGSYPFQLRRGGTLSPYGRINIRFEIPSGQGADTELEFGLNGGVEWKATPTVIFYTEFQIDGNDGIFLGVDFNVM